MSTNIISKTILLCLITNFLFNQASNETIEKPNIIEYPKSIEDLQKILFFNPSARVKPTIEWNNGIFSTSGVQISMEHFNDIQCCFNNVALVGRGVTFNMLFEIMKPKKKALRIAPDFKDMNIIEFIITGGHGSGFSYGILAERVIAFTMLTSDGTVREYRRRDPHFKNILINMEYSGIILNVSLWVEPTYPVKRCIFENMDILNFTRFFHNLFSSWDYAWYIFNPATKMIETIHTIKSLSLFERLKHDPETFFECPETFTKSKLNMNHSSPFLNQFEQKETQEWSSKWYESLFLFQDLDLKKWETKKFSQYYIINSYFLIFFKKFRNLSSEFINSIDRVILQPVNDDSFDFAFSHSHAVISFRIYWHDNVDVESQTSYFETMVNEYIISIGWLSEFSFKYDQLNKMSNGTSQLIRNTCNTLDFNKKFNNSFFKEKFEETVEVEDL